MNSAADTLPVANEIIRQLGGNSAMYMIGAKQIVGEETFVQFKVMRNAKGVTTVRVELMPDDTYTVQFWNIRGLTMKLLHTATMVCVDTLRSVFEGNTGLYLKL